MALERLSDKRCGFVLTLHAQQQIALRDDHLDFVIRVAEAEFSQVLQSAFLIVELRIEHVRGTQLRFHDVRPARHARIRPQRL